MEFIYCLHLTIKKAMKKSFLFLLLIAGQLTAQKPTTKEIKTTLKEATVFIEGAHLKRTGEITLIKGKTLLEIKGLSPFIDEKSIQVKGFGDFTILSVNHHFNHIDKLQKNQQLETLKNKAIQLEKEITSNNARLEVLKEKQTVLQENKKLGGTTTGASLSDLKSALEFYEHELTEIKKDELSVKATIEKLAKEKENIEIELTNVLNNEELPVSDIKVLVSAEFKTQAEVTITYLVSNAGWYPNYDLRVNSINSPLLLNYKANVWQNTGVDWENIDLVFSNANPNQSGVAPLLTPWKLNYHRNTVYNTPKYQLINPMVRSVSGKVISAEDNEPIPFVNILVKGTTIGTTTDFDGKYQLTLPNNAEYLTFSYVGCQTQQVAIGSSVINVKMQDGAELLAIEVCKVQNMPHRSASSIASTSGGYTLYSYKAPLIQKSVAKTIITTTFENQTSVEFKAPVPYSVNSKGETVEISLNEHEIETIYEYYAIPKLDKDAFLMARMINWEQYHFLEGEANLYFEDAFVGRSILNAKSMEDTLNISLGRDKNIVIERVKKEDFTQKRNVGNNKIESLGFELSVRNKKSEPIQLTLFDQIPVAAISDIHISTIETSNGNLNEKTGELTWKLNIPSKEKAVMNLSYEVKYPKREMVTLE